MFVETFRCGSACFAAQVMLWGTVPFLVKLGVAPTAFKRPGVLLTGHFPLDWGLRNGPQLSPYNQEKVWFDLELQ